MYSPTYKDWPKSHIRLLQLFLSIAILFFMALWFVVLPQWRRLKTMQREVRGAQEALKNRGVRPDIAMMEGHINECARKLGGEDGVAGLNEIASNLFLKATHTFDRELSQAYPANVEVDRGGVSSLEIFVANASRIDYKDLYDRVVLEFNESGVLINQKSLSPEDESSEPVYHQILKLMTMRKLVQLMYSHHLSLEKSEDGVSRISALKSISYVSGEKDVPYLLEFPVRMCMQGKLEDFLAFADELLEDETFLPIRNISIYSEPPKDFPVGSVRNVNTLHYNVICSLFFIEPQQTAKSQNVLQQESEK